MSEGPRQVTFQEWVGQLRGQIILAYDGSKEIALKNFDLMTTKFSEQMQINEVLKKSMEKTVKVPKKK